MTSAGRIEARRLYEESVRNLARQAEGIRARQARGEHYGRPYLLTPERVELAREFVNDGLSKDQAAVLFKVSRSTMFRALARNSI